MSYNGGKTSSELWAVIDDQRQVVWTRGGSSSTPRLMVYESKGKAERALKNYWIKQQHSGSTLVVRCVYKPHGQEVSE